MRYYFNLAGTVHDPDNDGLELANLGLAREYAVLAAAEYLRDHPDVVWLGEEFRLEVTDEARLVLSLSSCWGSMLRSRGQRPEPLKTLYAPSLRSAFHAGGSPAPDPRSTVPWFISFGR
jgi:hypothetical protein